MLTLSYPFIFCIDDSNIDLYFLRLLTFEDGYFDYLKLQQSCSNVTRDGYPGHEDVINFIFRKKVLGREFNGCPIEFGLDYLSCRQYALGEGYDLVLHVTPVSVLGENCNHIRSFFDCFLF